MKSGNELTTLVEVLQKLVLVYQELIGLPVGLPGRGDEPLTRTADPFWSPVRGVKGSIPVAAKTKAYLYKIMYRQDVCNLV